MASGADESIQLLARKAATFPVGHDLRPYPLIEIDRRLVPIQNVPLEPCIALCIAVLREIKQKCLADATPAKVGQNVQVFEPDPSFTEKRRIGPERNAVPNNNVFAFGDMG